jgi:peptide-methionine (R)-S-oxide reductase
MVYLKLIVLSWMVLLSCNTKAGKISDAGRAESNSAYFVNFLGDTIPRLILSEDEWKSKLTDEEFHVLRQKGTERAFSGSLLRIKDQGLYCCKGCGMPLFDSKHKFDSGTGWPSFYDVVDINGFILETDYKIGYPRTEVMCGKCGGHLGHVFEDGPAPTGLRYCINSVSLEFVRAENH